MMPRTTWKLMADVALFGEAAVTLVIAGVVVRCVPFRWIVSTLGRTARESPVDESDDVRARVRHIRWAVNAASHRLPWGCSCLTQGIGGKAMLKRRGIASTLYLGVDTSGGDTLRAHAWLRSGSDVVTGAAGREQYATVATFAE